MQLLFTLLSTRWGVLGRFMGLAPFFRIEIIQVNLMWPKEQRAAGCPPHTKARRLQSSSMLINWRAGGARHEIFWADVKKFRKDVGHFCYKSIRYNKPVKLFLPPKRIISLEIETETIMAGEEDNLETLLKLIYYRIQSRYSYIYPLGFMRLRYAVWHLLALLQEGTDLGSD